MKKSIPTRSVSGKSSLPWLTPPIRRALGRRNHAHREAKRRNLPDLWRRFRLLRNWAVSVLRQAKKHFLDQLSLLRDDQKAFWRLYRSTTAVKSRVPAILHLGNESAGDAVGEASLLNQHFVSVYNKKVSTSTVLPEPHPLVCLDYPPSPVTSRMFSTLLPP